MKISERHTRTSVRPRGFTLIELLVVVAVIAVLISILLPAIQQTREAARRNQCKNNLLQIGVALSNYEMSHGVLPPGTENVTGPIQSKEMGGYHMSWTAQILPYLDQQNAFNKIDFDASVYDPVNSPVRSHNIHSLVCPTDPAAGRSLFPTTNYCGVHNDFETPIDVNQNGVLFLNSSIRYDNVSDGSSYTLYVVETQVDGRSGLGWMSGTHSTLRNLVVPTKSGSSPGGTAPLTSDESDFQLHLWPDNRKSSQLTKPLADTANSANPVLNVGGPSGHHASGVFNSLLGDGSVRSLSKSISPKLLRNLGHRADGELIEGSTF